MFDRWTSRLFAALVGIIPVLFVLDLKDTFDLPKMTLVYFSVIVLAGLWGWQVVEKKELVCRSTALNKPIAVFQGVALLAACYSIEPVLSFWGAYRIYVFGWLPMAAFAALFWLSAQVQDA